MSAVVRKAAAESLGKIGDSQAIVPLLAALEDRQLNVVVREGAAEGLGLIGGIRMMDLLIQGLETVPFIDSRLIISAWGSIGDARALAPLLRLLKAEPWDAAEALGKMADPRAVEPLLDALQSTPDDAEHGTHMYQAIRIVVALGKTGDSRAIDSLRGT